LRQWSFLALAERCREHFPADAFVAAVLAALSAKADPGARWRGTMIAARIASRVQDIADRAPPLPLALGQKLLCILDALVDRGIGVARRCRSVRPSATCGSSQSAIYHLRRSTIAEQATIFGICFRLHE